MKTGASTDTITTTENGRADEPIKLITAVVQRGKADEAVQAAIEAGAQGATVVFGRGQGIRERLGLLAFAIQSEKEVIYIVIEERLLDRVLTAMIKASNLDQPGLGFIYVTPIERTIGLMAAEEREKIQQESDGARRSFLHRWRE